MPELGQDEDGTAQTDAGEATTTTTATTAATETTKTTEGSRTGRAKYVLTNVFLYSYILILDGLACSCS